ncbi:superoxide dismutase [Paenibacillus sp. P96]|uniref:superoxide dismutase n=1 Tax=Paenibacillus zeirhizosphaerae TaxID=2987519 RepID=A0ABT9FLL7_9BACL|nr:superoxide dismutase [Paenibacillus sp. P96]MDP4095628.1 superoxide dismutase [Paenibacillus sp. P96]
MTDVFGSLPSVRLLKQIESWKSTERSHISALQEAVPNLEPAYARLLVEWGRVFDETRKITTQVLDGVSKRSGIIDEENIESTGKATQRVHSLQFLLQESSKQSREFRRQMSLLPSASAVIRDSSAAAELLQRADEDSAFYLQTADDYDPQKNNHLQEGLSRSTGEARKASLAPPVPIGEHSLPPLPYPYDALEPHIDEATMRLHHDKHHKSYVDGLNQAEKKLEEARKTNDFALVKHWERELAFHGAGHYLHTLFWNTMSPQGGGTPVGALADQIQQDFGSFDAFKQQFSEAAEKVEGSGWAILVWSPRAGHLEILQAEKHQNLSQWDVIPLLPLDVWEHAYYLKHQNERRKYIDDWWNVVNWPAVDKRFALASQLRWTPY